MQKTSLNPKNVWNALKLLKREKMDDFPKNVEQPYDKD